MMTGAKTSETKKGGKKEEQGDSRLKQAMKKAAAVLMLEGAIFGAVAFATQSAGCKGDEFTTEEEKPPIPGKDAQDEKSPEAGEDAELDSKTDGGPDAMDDAVDAGEDALDSSEDALDSGEDTFEAGEDVLDAGEDVADADEDVVDSGEDSLEAGEDASDTGLDSGEDALETGPDAMEGGMDAADAPLDVKDDVADGSEDASEAGTVCDGITTTTISNVQLPRGVIIWNGGLGSEYADLPFSSEGIHVSLYCMSGGNLVKLVSEEWVADNATAVWDRPTNGFTATLHLDYASFSQATADFTSAPQ